MPGCTYVTWSTRRITKPCMTSPRDATKSGRTAAGRRRHGSAIAFPSPLQPPRLLTFLRNQTLGAKSICPLLLAYTSRGQGQQGRWRWCFYLTCFGAATRKYTTCIFLFRWWRCVQQDQGAAGGNTCRHFSPPSPATAWPLTWRSLGSPSPNSPSWATVWASGVTPLWDNVRSFWFYRHLLTARYYCTMVLRYGPSNVNDTKTEAQTFRYRS